MNPLKKLASQTAIYGLPTMVGRLINYFLVPLYTYQFSPSEYGVVTEMYAYVSFLIVILTYGMETALFRFSHTETDKDLVYTTSMISLLVTSLTFVFFCFTFSTQLADILQYPNHREYILLFAIIVAADAFSWIPFARLREQNKAKRFAIIKSVHIILNVVLNVFVIGFCKPLVEQGSGTFYKLATYVYDPQVGVGYVFILNLITSLFTLVLLLPDIIKVKYRFDFSLWKRMMPYALPLLIGGLAGMTNETMDRILIKYLLPADTRMEQLGIYGACYKVSIIMTIFIQTFRYAAEPFFFSHAKKEDAKKMYADVMKYFVATCSLIFLATMLNIDWIQTLIGERYRSGIKVVPILLMANLFLGIFFNLSIWYKLSGQTRYGAYLTGFGAVITLVLNIYLIPRIGYMGSAWATLICYAAMMVASYLIGQRFYAVNYNLVRVFTYLFMAVTLYFLSDHFIPQLSKYADIFIRNLIVLAFLIFIYFIERKNFSHENQNS